MLTKQKTNEFAMSAKSARVLIYQRGTEID